jgi:hypothetical protein
VAIAAIGEIFGLWCVLPDHRPLAAMGLIAPHAGYRTVPQIRQHCTSATLGGVAIAAWISFVLLSTPRCAFTPKYH